MAYIRELLNTPIFDLFAIVAIGMWVGSIRIRNISLGAAGVLFVALVFGHFGHVLPRVLTDLGLLFFVYAVGLQAGPRFFAIFKARGKAFLAVGISATAASAVAAMVLARAFHIPAPLAAGLYAGATTCTPALAAAMDAVRVLIPDQVNVVSVGYGVAYPFSTAATVLFVQILPALFRVSPARAAEEARQDQVVRGQPIETRALRVTNPNCCGRTIGEFQNLGISQAKISRVKRAGSVAPARPDTTLQEGDLVLAVGPEPELDKLGIVLGKQVDEPMTDPTGTVGSEEIVVSRPAVIGKSLRALAAWEEYGVVVTRVRREGMEVSPDGSLVLEPADVLRVVGSANDVDAFAHIVGREERRLDETSLLPFAAGLALGAAVGMVQLPLPGGFHSELGTGAGAFIVALLLGHLGHIGPMRFYVPNAAKYLTRELGLVIFLAGAGSGAGERLVPILRTTGPTLVLAGIGVTLVALAAGYIVLRYVVRWNMLAAAGALPASMTSTPGLSAANNLAYSDAPTLAFATLYPVSLICKIILIQVILAVLK